MTGRGPQRCDSSVLSFDLLLMPTKIRIKDVRYKEIHQDEGNGREDSHRHITATAA